ncbi:MAG: exosortase Y-associated Wzy-like protein [Sphingobacteriales bacterium]
MKGAQFEKYLVLYLPWLFSLLFKSDPEVSFLIAWAGSLFIFYVTLNGWVKPIPKDRSIPEQLMRPIFLVQIIFAGYTCTTSIFYFLNVLGYQDFHKASQYYLIDYQRLALTAQCQRYYCLGHAAFVTGILMFMHYPEKQEYYIEKEKIAGLLFWSAIISLPVSIMFSRVSGLSQFASQFSSLSFIAVTLALAFAIPLHKIWNTLICFIFYFFNFYQALISGFKEPIIISILVLGIFLYPTYKKIVLAIFTPAIILLFVLLPTYNRIFRENAWGEEVSADEASQLALDAALNSSTATAEESNWEFLAFRLSEIDMFTTYAYSTPDRIDFYGLTLLKQSAIAIVPRIFWPSKPITEDLVMERVYDAGVINKGSNVSAKPAFIADAYLSGGGFGVFIAMLLYGAVAQLISLHAEKLFGGYILGTALIFSGLFQIFWRGLSFEFLINTVFWAYISMIIIQKIMVGSHLLKKI